MCDFCYFFMWSMTVSTVDFVTWVT
jgi:hypothetical protein